MILDIILIFTTQKQKVTIMVNTCKYCTQYVCNSFVFWKRPHFCYSQWFCTDKIKKMQPCGFPLLLSKHYWKYNLESSKQKIIRLTAAVCLHSWKVLRLTLRSVGQLRLTLASTWGSSARWVHILPQCAKGHQTAIGPLLACAQQCAANSGQCPPDSAWANVPNDPLRTETIA